MRRRDLSRITIAGVALALLTGVAPAAASRFRP
ncbi:glycoside hydrolase family 18 protein [Streptomyces californicus]